MKVAKKRRRQGRTDYAKRIKLLKSLAPRIVFRKSNKYVLAQYVTSKYAQDRVEINKSSKELLKYGWPKSKNLKSLPASYLLGLLIGKEIAKKREKPIVDFGMLRTVHKTKIYAFLKGLIDSGVEIKCDKEAFPDEDRLKGKHLKNKINFDEIKARVSMG